MIGIASVYYNQPEYLMAYLNSLVNQSYKEFIIYLIDNSSSEEVVNSLHSFEKEKLLNIKYLKQAVNTGYAAGTNIGAKQAISDGCKYIFILNIDVELHKDCIQELVSQIESEQNIIGTGPIILRHTNESRDIVQEYGGEINFRTGIVVKYYTNRFIDELNLPLILKTDFISGGALLMRADIFERAGMLEESYFAYFDEVDLFYRIGKLGNYSMFVTSKAVLWHLHDWSPQNPHSYYFEYYLGERNKFIFFYKFRFYGSILYSVFIDLLKFPVRLFWFKSVCNYKIGFYYIKGLMHGILNIKGKPKFIT